MSSDAVGVEKKTAVVIGYGRFGALLVELLKDSFEFSVIPGKEVTLPKNVKKTTVESVGEYDFVFPTVPIAAFEDTIVEIKPFLKANQTIVDVCSVKVFPARIMEKHLLELNLIATHPLFGPDSAKQGLDGLKVAFAPLRCDEPNANYLRLAWESIGVQVIDTTPEEHDRDTSYSQAFTYSVARIVVNMNLPEVRFDTRSFQSTSRVAQYSANDSDQLFHDMMFYNPYFPDMLKQLEASWLDTLATLETINDEPRPDELAGEFV